MRIFKVKKYDFIFIFFVVSFGFLFVWLVGWVFVVVVCFFETGFLCVALAVLELTL